ncbi:hypothetical protein [Streptomyces abikoensis]|uniref:Uncharacterized protein n=1 Tax=Streptomyces abikoensis TaxID=97398 RepID=A0ABW7TCN5_9ACTN
MGFATRGTATAAKGEDVTTTREGNNGMAMVRTGCPVATELTVEERRLLADLEAGAHALEDFTWCELEPGHDGDWHYALGQSTNEGPWWLRWRPGARELAKLDLCPVRDIPGDLTDPAPCLLFDGHPGRHDFEYGIAENSQGLLHRSLTVGDLRKAIEGLDDTVAIRVGATAHGVLPTTDHEALLQAVADGAVPSTEGGRTPALVGGQPEYGGNRQQP